MRERGNKTAEGTLSRAATWACRRACRRVTRAVLGASSPAVIKGGGGLCSRGVPGSCKLVTRGIGEIFCEQEMSYNLITSKRQRRQSEAVSLGTGETKGEWATSRRGSGNEHRTCFVAHSSWNVTADETLRHSCNYSALPLAFASLKRGPSQLAAEACEHLSSLEALIWSGGNTRRWTARCESALPAEQWSVPPLVRMLPLSLWRYGRGAEQWRQAR